MLCIVEKYDKHLAFFLHFIISCNVEGGTVDISASFYCGF